MSTVLLFTVSFYLFAYLLWCDVTLYGLGCVCQPFSKCVYLGGGLSCMYWMLQTTRQRPRICCCHWSSKRQMEFTPSTSHSHCGPSISFSVSVMSLCQSVLLVCVDSYPWTSVYSVFGGKYVYLTDKTRQTFIITVSVCVLHYSGGCGYGRCAPRAA